MRLPKLLAEEERLMEQIQLNLPPEAAIIRPRKSNQMNTVPILDLNGDGNEEAVMFYKDKGNKDKIVGQVWSRALDGWKMADTIQGEGNELDTLKFVDLMGNGRLSILVGYSSLSSKDQKGLTIYSMGNEGQLQKQLESSYQELIIDDLDGDGKKDMTVITHERGRDKDIAWATLYQYDRTLAERGKTSLDPYVNGYYNVLSGQVSANKRAVILEAGIGAHSSKTQLLVWDAGQLKTIFPERDNPTFRAYSALSMDVDQDGIVEIPKMIAPPGYEEAAMVEIPWILQFYKWDGGTGLSFVLERYTENNRGFYINIPQDWYGRYTLERTEHSLRFLSMPDRSLLAEIRYIPVELWRDDEDGAWIELTRTANTVYIINQAAASSGKEFFHLVTETVGQEEDFLL
jgi:hypothetical protein